MPPCFSFCWNSNNEPHKKGALFEEATHHRGGGSARITTRNFNNNSNHQHSRSYIPWVWSKQFHETYQLGGILGRGAFAVVHNATTVVPPPPLDHDDDNNHHQQHQQQQSYAIKVFQRIRMTRQDLSNFSNEVQILLDLRHEHIVRLHELYKTPDYFFVVMEKLDGGELFDRLCEKEYFSEMEARNICRTVFDAVAYLHAQKIAHRDLKPENLLLVSRNNNNDDDDHGSQIVVKVADFGFAKRVPRPNSLWTRCGSPAFTAPEIINFQTAYDERVDNWSLGVIVYTLLGGYNPFQEATVHLTYQQIRQANYQFDPEYWDGISRDAKQLIRGLLTRDPDRRLTAEGALSHPWMIGRGTDLRQHAVNLKQLKKFTVERKERIASNEVRSANMYWLLTRR